MTVANGNLVSRYRDIRSQSESICQTLEPEDYQVQPMDNASPPKWHLAHVSWFFETFILKPLVPGYQPYNEAFEVLYNSYYNGVGQQFPRARRGHLSRPTVAEILAYRKHVDDEMCSLLAGPVEDALVFRVELGLQHEQQHQELLYTDIKYNLGNNPLFPALITAPKAKANKRTRTVVEPMSFKSVSGGIREIGWPDSEAGFCFDNETPRHPVLVGDFEIGHRLVTNGEFLEFMEDNGYSRPELWLSDAWTFLAEEHITHPLYWVPEANGWQEYTLHGLASLNPELPVSHVSGYEADAYARWAKARLPTEPEWEIAAAELANQAAGNFRESGKLHPEPAPAAAPGLALTQMFGDLWEWTSSSYGPYPGFRPFEGQLGEYNGKFMANQLVLRGGSCVSPQNHIRVSYRNFFYPGDRWQFTGIRLARDSH